MTPGTVSTRTTLTFLLPVLNRREVIVRAIDSCLACESEHVESRVLVIDGGSSDGTRTLIESHFRDEPRVSVFEQPRERPGFMNACYFAVGLLGDGLATFMYSDDLVSPHFVRLADALVAAPEVSIALGYGKQAAQNEIIDFPQIVRVDRVPADSVLRAFYGRTERLDRKSLPVSPVCCVVRSEILKAWAPRVQNFTSGWPLRHHSMIRLAGGPDLMIYLSALIHGGAEALRADAIVGQLTVTAVSITSTGNREMQLTVGYWLARVWGFGEVTRRKGSELSAGLGGYLLAVWVYIVCKKIARAETTWARELVAELTGVWRLLAAQSIRCKALASLIGSVYSRIRLILAN